MFALALPFGAQATDALTQYADALAWPDRPETAQIAFTEEREFPFRKYPKRFAGQMFRAPSGELAIIYIEPRPLRLIIKPTEIILDQGDGEVRDLPTDSADARAIGDLLRGDLEQLRIGWTNETIDGGLRLTPKEGAAGEAVKFIDVRVTDGRVSAVAVYQRNQVVRRYAFGELTWVSGADAARPFALE